MAGDRPCLCNNVADASLLRPENVPRIAGADMRQGKMRYAKAALLLFGSGLLLGLAVVAADLPWLERIASAAMALGLLLLPIAILIDFRHSAFVGRFTAPLRKRPPRRARRGTRARPQTRRRATSRRRSGR
jgi:hypothetical protein